MELLTGKCKQDFEKWLVNNQDIQDIKNKDIKMHHWLSFKGFKNWSISMQYGVLVDFFHYTHHSYSKKIYNEILSLIMFEFKSPEYARKQAIIKANELYNEKL